MCTVTIILRFVINLSCSVFMLFPVVDATVDTELYKLNLDVAVMRSYQKLLDVHRESTALV